MSKIFKIFDPFGITRSMLGDGRFTSVNYQAIYNAMTTPPNDTVAVNQDILVKALEDSGVWTKLDIFYVFAQEINTASEALINWKSPGTYDCTLGNIPTFTSLEGFTGNGTNAYLDTNFNPFVNKINLSLDSTSFGVYVRTNVQENGRDIGCFDSSNLIELISRHTDGKAYYWSNNNAAPSVTNADSRGFYIANRTASNVQDLYKNKSKIKAATNASVGIPNQDVFLFARNNNGTPTEFSTKQLSMTFLASGLTQGNIDNITDAFEVYMDSNGKGIIP